MNCMSREVLPGQPDRRVHDDVHVGLAAGDRSLKGLAEGARCIGSRTQAMGETIFVEMGIEESVRRSEEEHRRDHERYRRARVTAVGISPPEALQALADITTEATLHVGAAATAMGLPRFDGQDVRQKRAKPTMGGGVGGGGAAAEVTGLVSSYVTGELTLNVLTQRFRTRQWPVVPVSSWLQKFAWMTSRRGICPLVAWIIASRTSQNPPRRRPSWLHAAGRRLLRGPGCGRAADPGPACLRRADLRLPARSCPQRLPPT